MSQSMTQSKASQPSANQQTLVTPHSGSTGTTRPTHAEIAKRAYEIYLKTGRLQAEQELRKQGTAAFQSKPSGDKPTVTHSFSSGSR